MTRVIFFLGLMLALLVSTPVAVQAQQQVWLQIEAQPTLAEAEGRARAYTGVFPDVAGFQMGSGWYAIAIGPYDAGLAPTRLAELKAERLVPADSFIADGRVYRNQFWPVGPGAVLPQAAAPEAVTPEAVAPEAIPEAAPEAAPEPEVAVVAPLPVPEPVFIEETPAEARRSEAALAADDRKALQTALQWFGHYNAAIDGAFGPGTRKSMAAWQEAAGLEPTGILTTTQRADLLAAYGTAQAELGLQLVTEPESGIEITLPLALVQFDHFEPPFVHYAEKAGSGVRVILISQPGDQATLYGLYDILQTLEVVPLDGERSRDERSFTLTGRSATVQSHSYAELSGGLVKGYMLIWGPDQDADRMARVLAAMQKSFKGVGDRALDPGLVPMPDTARQGLLSGLEVRRPGLSRSGFYVDAAGAVLTTTEAVQNCSRITLDGDTEADVVLTDAALGIAVLKPRKPLAPAVVAELLTGPARLGGEIAVSGYSYEDLLPAPVLSFGTLEAATGLNGEPGMVRLAVTVLAGDAGGPVLDGAGSVLGMLLPRVSDAARQLPAGVDFAASAPALAAKLAEAGITPAASARAGALAPEDLTGLAEGMTVLVSCWN
ncbi:serine protease [Rhodobacter ferrooxidans]|uniref:Peptidoglycan-binding domain 1 protein n=1 Tax=Rhodobacter ferrooxidans TaxID=371731 RepID=C8S0D1_9RHOB|nr:serine protease [Rhodobacter sp. SW2]EEW25465.1 Peptidoglycan-binding domain 1 protein [Rhodobacter sp. SW2]